jgi:hypothetical protein
VRQFAHLRILNKPKRNAFSSRRKFADPPNEEITMKPIVSLLVALGLAVAFSGSALAAEKAPKTQAACEKAHMTWDATGKKCSKGAM